MKKYYHDNTELIKLNKVAHDRIALDYDEKHVEIYNLTEQRRINGLLMHVLSLVMTGAEKKMVLDFGAGTGNLTMHLWGLGAEVVAADVSEESLKRIREKTGDSNRLMTIVLGGENLSNISNSAFDMAATYSVLHHIPDYLAAVEELVRVVKPGGIVFLDHEVSPSYWYWDKFYNEYLKELGGKFLDDHLHELGISRPRANKGFMVLTLRAKVFCDLFRGKREKPKQSDHGDIHVYKHDHVEWEKIADILLRSCDILTEKDYLVCRERSENPTVWRKWQGKCRDMRYIIARKKVCEK
jgi:ubiquinone/menaquinone biosynthesis C-methylase UbiE